MPAKIAVTSDAKVCCKCIDCINAELHQWDNNPLVSWCRITPRKEVARSIIRCYHFLKRNANTPLPPVIHHSSNN